MNIKYSSRAVDRMLQRKISTLDVELIISEPDGKIKQSLEKYIYYKKIKERADNSAVTVLKNNTHEVITVMINFEVK